MIIVLIWYEAYIKKEQHTYKTIFSQVIFSGLMVQKPRRVAVWVTDPPYGNSTPLLIKFPIYIVIISIKIMIQFPNGVTFRLYKLGD